MATNPNVEGDGTALFLSNQLAEYPVKLTRLARGVTTGSVLEATNKEILADALTVGKLYRRPNPSVIVAQMLGCHSWPTLA